MSKKLRVLVLSVIAVLFAVSSAFAITADDLGSLITESDDNAATTEGYNYRHKIFIDTTDPSTDIKSVSWEVYPSGDISWLTWTISSLDVVFEGVLPAFVSSDDAAANTYIVHVVAYTSGDIDDNEPPTQGTISADFNETGLGITVEKEATTVSEFPDMVSIDIASTDRGLYKVTDIYSVLINFPTTTAVTITDSVDVDDNPVSGEYVFTSSDVFVNAQLEYTSSDIAAFEENLNLPSWLKYEVVDTQYAGSYTESDDGTLVYEKDTSTAYVKTLRIFYSADTKPSSNAAGSVRVIVTPASTASITDESSTGGTSADRTTQTFEEKYANGTTIGWNVNYYAIPGISFDVTEASYDVIYGTSADVGSADLKYHYQAPVSVVFSPDISADVYISWDKVSTSTSTDEEAGYITLTVTPKTPLIKTYSTDMIVTDSYDNTAAVTLYISVLIDSILISPDTSDTISIDAGKSADISFTAYNFSGKVSWDLGTIPSGITVTSSDSGDYSEALTLTVTASEIPGAYSFDITATDSDSRSADITVTVNVVPPAPPVPPVPGVSFSVSPASTTVTVKAGASQDVSFTASNNSGDVRWTLGTVPSGVTVAPSSSAYATQGNTRMVYTVTGVTSGDYTVTVTATDSAGRTSNAAMNITVTATVLSISASPSSVIVEEGSTANVTLSATGNSGLVTWTLGSQPSGALVTPTASQTGTSAAYTVAGVTAGSSSSFTVTATDAAGNTDSETISVTVTSGDTPVPGREAGNTPAGSLSDATKAAVAILVGNGMLVNNGTDGGTLPERAVQYPVVNSSYVTLSRTGTTNITKSSDINPIDLVLSFDVDIWRIYINNSIVAWAYSPGVTPAEFDGKNDFSASAGNHSGSGIEILPQSASEAQINFTAADMPTGNNVIASAFVLDIASPDQEIGKTTIATVNVSSGSPSSDEEYGVGSSSGGCSAGLGAIVSALAAAFFISKKRS